MSARIPAKRFVCLEDGELDYINMRITGQLLRKVNDFPSDNDYIERFGDVGFIEFKITIKNGYLHIEDPKVDHSKSSYIEWDDSDVEAWEDRVEVFTSVKNWKDKILRRVDPQSPEHSGLINTGCGDPSLLIIDQPDDEMRDINRKRLEKFDNGEPYWDIDM